MEHAGTDEARQLLLRLLELAERMESRDARVIGLLSQQAAHLQSAAHDVQAGGRRLASDALDLLREQSRDAVQAGMEEAAAQGRDRLARAAADATRASDALRAASHALQRRHRLWTWTAPIALITGSLLAVGASAYAVADARSQVQRHRIEAALLRAYNGADVTLCGDRLCANVDTRARPVGRYRPVAPRRAGE